MLSRIIEILGKMTSFQVDFLVEFLRTNSLSLTSFHNLHEVKNFVSFSNKRFTLSTFSVQTTLLAKFQLKPTRLNALIFDETNSKKEVHGIFSKKAKLLSLTQDYFS